MGGVERGRILLLAFNPCPQRYLRHQGTMNLMRSADGRVNNTRQFSDFA